MGLSAATCTSFNCSSLTGPGASVIKSAPICVIGNAIIHDEDSGRPPLLFDLLPLASAEGTDPADQRQGRDSRCRNDCYGDAVDERKVQIRILNVEERECGAG